MDYLVVLMLMTSVLACTVQLSRDRVVCIPAELPFNASNGVHPPVGSDAVLASSEAPLHVPHSIGPNLQSPAQGRRTHLVYQQYIFVSQVLLFTFGLYMILRINC